MPATGTTNMAGLATIAAMLLPLLAAPWTAHAAGTTGTTAGGGSWSTDGTAVTPPSGAAAPSYQGLDASGQRDAEAVDPATNTVLTIHQDATASASRTWSMPVYAPGRASPTMRTAVYLENAGLRQNDLTVGEYAFGPPLAYFSALVDFSGPASGDITFYDGAFNALATIDPMADAYQTNTDANGRQVYSMFLAITSATGISYADFALTNASDVTGGPSYLSISQQYQSVDATTAGGTDVPEPEAVALLALVGLGVATATRRRNIAIR